MQLLIRLLNFLCILLPLHTLAAGETAMTALNMSFLTNPNVAYLLLLIGIYGIFFELANPGLIFPGVTGIIALLLVLYSFQIIPINSLGRIHHAF